MKPSLTRRQWSPRWDTAGTPFYLRTVTQVGAPAPHGAALNSFWSPLAIPSSSGARGCQKSCDFTAPSDRGLLWSPPKPCCPRPRPPAWRGSFLCPGGLAASGASPGLPPMTGGSVWVLKAGGQGQPLQRCDPEKPADTRVDSRNRRQAEHARLPAPSVMETSVQGIQMTL